MDRIIPTCFIKETLGMDYSISKKSNPGLVTAFSYQFVLHDMIDWKTAEGLFFITSASIALWTILLNTAITDARIPNLWLDLKLDHWKWVKNGHTYRPKNGLFIRLFSLLGPPPGSKSLLASNGQPTQQLQHLSLSVLDAFGSVHDILQQTDLKHASLAQTIGKFSSKCYH